MTETKSSAGDNAIREYLAGAAPERFAIGDERTNRRTAVTIPMTKANATLHGIHVLLRRYRPVLFVRKQAWKLLSEVPQRI